MFEVASNESVDQLKLKSNEIKKIVLKSILTLN